MPFYVYPARFQADSVAYVTHAESNGTNAASITG